MSRTLVGYEYHQVFSEFLQNVHINIVVMKLEKIKVFNIVCFSSVTFIQHLLNISLVNLIFLMINSCFCYKIELIIDFLDLSPCLCMV